MSISVVIPTFNRARLAQRTVEFLLGLACHEQIMQIILVDDRSTDDSVAYLSAQNFGPKVRVLTSSTKGRAGARNTGIREARGDIVLFLDDDIRCARDLIGAHLRAHEEHAEPVAVQGRVLPDPESNATVWGEYEDRRFEKIHRLASASPTDAPYNCFLTGNVSIPREALQRVGGFDESFAGYGFEDYDLGRRLRKHGVRLIYAEDALAYHWTEPLTLRQLSEKRYAAGFSAALLISKAPEAVQELSMAAPFSVPPYWRRPEADSIAKRVLKQVIFTRPTAGLLTVLSRVIDRPERWRILPRALYCWYGLGFGAGARAVSSRCS